MDLAKAYDRVEWTVLFQILHLFGFGAKLIQLIRECITTAKFSILLNGSPHGYFKSERGLRQGDPLSPALFTILSYILSRLLADSVQSGKLSGVKISRNSPRISHLMYADDLVLYVKATDKEAVEVRRILQVYCDCTGQQINWSKSSIHFSHNVTRCKRGTLCHILEMQECNHKGKYLGQPFCHFKSKKEAFNGVFENLSRKLTGWKQRNLSMAGRMILIKAVAHALPSYSMQLFMLPKGLLARMERKVIDFFLGL